MLTVLAKRRWTSLLVLALVVVLAACSSDDSSGQDDDPIVGDVTEAPAADVTEPSHDEPEIEIGPAPAATAVRSQGGTAVRIDEVTRSGDRVEIAMTFAATYEQRLRDERIRFVTNTGVELPRAIQQDRTIPEGSEVAIEVVATGVDPAVHTLQMDIDDLAVSFPLPDDGVTSTWAPAAERQTGFTDVVLRGAANIAIVPYTFRTEGMVSEVTLSGVLTTGGDISVCRSRSGCQLEDAAGGVYPAIGYLELSTFDRFSATLRFIGEIPPDQTELRLVIGGSASPRIDFVHEFALASAEETPLRVTGGLTTRPSFNVGQTLDSGEGVVLTLGEMAFFEDRIQLHIEADAADYEGRRATRLNHNDAFLRDANYEHPLRPPPHDRFLEIEAGQRFEATLVFLTPVDPDATQLQLAINEGAGGYPSFETVIELPPLPAGDDTGGDE